LWSWDSLSFSRCVCVCVWGGEGGSAVSQRARVGYPEGTLSHQSYPEKEGDEEGGAGRDKEGGIGERERERESEREREREHMYVGDDHSALLQEIQTNFLQRRMFI